VTEQRENVLAASSGLRVSDDKQLPRPRESDRTTGQEEFTGMTTPDVSGELEAAAQRVRELGEQVAEQARKNGLAWLEGYERMLKNLLDLEEQAAKGTGAEWATTLASTHANFVRETSEVVFGALRQQLKS
jgi:hypothetical protein